jgi:hypothetical protein
MLMDRFASEGLATVRSYSQFAKANVVPKLSRASMTASAPWKIRLPESCTSSENVSVA